MEKIDCSIKCINDCISKFNEKEKLKEEVLAKAFSGAPNTDLKAVLIRVALLNTFYSTRLSNTKQDKQSDLAIKTHIDVESMARHIADNSKLDAWTNSSDEYERLKAFDYIATEKSRYKTDLHFAAASFASKYCSWCNPDDYPIMDRYSRGMLYYTGSPCRMKQGKLIS